MPELRIPLAIDESGKLCSPVRAEKGKKYSCPVCGTPVIFRQGVKKVPHFAHKSSDTCSQETIIHKTAKLLVQKVINEWKSGKAQPPILKRSCQICGDCINQFLPDKVCGAKLECKLMDGSIVDVALVDEREKPLAAVEIRVTHAVEEAKAAELQVPFIELDGYEIIKDPTVWKPISDHFKPLICSNCKSTYSEYKVKAKRIAKASGIDLPDTYYRYGIIECWNCKQEIIVFAWPKKDLYDVSAPKVRPYPRTIKYRYTKTFGGKYWVNTCPYCQATQGDFFLHMEPDGPFFPVQVREDSPVAFEKDMMIIAFYAERFLLD